MRVMSRTEAEVIYSAKQTVSGQAVGLIKDGEEIGYYTALSRFLSICSMRAEGKPWWVDPESLKRCPKAFLEG